MQKIVNDNQYTHQSEYAGLRKRIFLLQTISLIRTQVKRAGESLYTFSKIYNSIPPYWRLSKWAQHQLVQETTSFLLQHKILEVWDKTNGNIIYKIDPQAAMSEKTESLMADLMGGTWRD